MKKKEFVIHFFLQILFLLMFSSWELFQEKIKQISWDRAERNSGETMPLGFG